MDDVGTWIIGVKFHPILSVTAVIDLTHDDRRVARVGENSHRLRVGYRVDTTQLYIDPLQECLVYKIGSGKGYDSLEAYIGVILGLSAEGLRALEALRRDSSLFQL